MSSDFIVILGFIIGCAIVFFDFDKYDVSDQEYRWLPYAQRRSMRFVVATLIALMVAWVMRFPVLVALFVILIIFFMMMYILLTFYLRYQKKRDLEESKRRDEALELLRKAK